MKNKLAKLTAVTLAASMVIGSSVTGMAASTNQTSEREVRNAQLSKEAAEEGMVLLENENQALPAGTGIKSSTLWYRKLWNDQRRNRIRGCIQPLHNLRL